jgi:rhodanese-related sulfurtransferase
MLALGLALGVAHNGFGLASRPPYGVPWIARPRPLAKLETLAPSGLPSASIPGARAETSGAASTPPVRGGSPEAAPPASGPTDLPGSRPAAAARPRASAPPAAPGPAGDPTPAATAPATDGARGRTAAPQGTPPGGGSGSPGVAKPVPEIPDVSGPLEIEIATFKALYDAGAALVLDAREASEYREGHIAGATSLPTNECLADPDRAKQVESSGRPIVVYCSGPDCGLSRELAELLVRSGKRRVLVFEGGYPAWSAAGYPSATGDAPGSRP